MNGLEDVGELRCALEQRGFTSVLHVTGTLDVGTSPFLRSAFLRCLADEPELIVLDLAAMRLSDDVVLNVFPALARHAAAWPGSPVAIAAAAPTVATALDRMAVCRYVPLYPSANAAIAQVASSEGASDARRRLSAQLEPSLAATAAARRVVDRACHTWDVPELNDIAQLIVTELVSNVIRHARTTMEVSVALRQRCLHLSVRDGSFEQPRPGGTPNVSLREEGRGLLVIEALTAGWGSTPTADGKVVWATLRAPANGMH
jgi:anti-sigma regulatory factor (Ser/Thr protein kinase)/anti-anti-sigma regulatory factor